jgi:hypothetical protein
MEVVMNTREEQPSPIKRCWDQKEDIPNPVISARNKPPHALRWLYYMSPNQIELNLSKQKKTYHVNQGHCTIQLNQKFLMFRTSPRKNNQQYCRVWFEEQRKGSIMWIDVSVLHVSACNYRANLPNLPSLVPLKFSGNRILGLEYWVGVPLPLMYLCI